MRQLLPTTYVMLVFLLTQDVIQSSDPQGPCRALTEPKSCFTFLLVTSVLAQSAAGSDTKGLEWQQQPGSQHSTGLNYNTANTQPGTSSSLLCSLYFFFIAATAECHLTASGGEWRAYFSYLCESRITFSSVEECSTQATKSKFNIQSVQMLFLWLKASINTLHKYSRNLVCCLHTVVCYWEDKKY